MYKVRQNPSDLLWYVLGRAGNYWMPVSIGYTTKQEAESKKNRQYLADTHAKSELYGKPLY